MSCYQGRTQDAAWDGLASLLVKGLGGGVGVQLTPGNLPSAGFRERVERSGVPVRRHHGFAWSAYRRAVWRDGLPTFTDPGRSVHPPSEGSGARIHAVLEGAHAAGWSVETMYPGELLGTGAQLREAMALGASLAVDISHLWIQRCAGVLGDADLAAVLDYDGVVEVHVSDNDGRTDQHRLPTSSSFLLDWALRVCAERRLPLIWESYLHRVRPDLAREAVDRLRSGLAGEPCPA